MSLAEITSTIEKPKIAEQKSFQEKANDVVESLRRSRSLYELKRSGKSTKAAIESTALTLSTSEDLGFSESEKSLLGVISHLGSFVTAQRRADEMGNRRDEGRLSQSERNEMNRLKNEDLIPFNHSIKELINTDSSLTKDELDANMTRLYMRLFYKDDPLVKRADTDGTQDQNLIKTVSQDALNSISVSTNGMRHEVAAESMLTAAAIEYDYQVDPEEDAQGADLFVYINNEWTYIDIKASETSARKALAKRSDSHAVWTGLNPSAFTGAKGTQKNGLRLSYEEAMSHADAFVDRIYDVAHR